MTKSFSLQQIMPNYRVKAKAKRDAMRRLRASRKDEHPCMSPLSVDALSHITRPPSTISTSHSSRSMCSPVSPSPSDISPPLQIALGLAPPQGNGIEPKKDAHNHEVHFTHPPLSTSSFHSSLSVCSQLH